MKDGRSFTRLGFVCRSVEGRPVSFFSFPNGDLSSSSVRKVLRYRTVAKLNNAGIPVCRKQKGEAADLTSLSRPLFFYFLLIF